MRALLAIVVVCAACVPAAAQKKPPRGARPAAKGPGPDLPSKAPPGAAAATVNGEAVTVSAYVDRLSLRFGPQIREELIADILLRQEAKQRKMAVSRAEVDAFVAKVYGETVRRMGSEQKLADDLRKTRGWSAEDYKIALRAQAEPQLIREKLAAVLVQDDGVSEADISARYEQRRQTFMRPATIRISHIMVRRAQGATAEQETAARTKAEGLLKRVRDAAGKNFEQIARENSEDPATAASGGRLPVDLAREANPFGAAFEAVVFNAPVGVVGEVVATPMGFHVIRVDERKGGGAVPLAEVREQIKAALLFERRAQALDELLLRLRTSAKIVTGKY